MARHSDKVQTHALTVLRTLASLNDDGLPNWSEAARKIGVSRRTLCRWWEEAGETLEPRVGQKPAVRMAVMPPPLAPNAHEDEEPPDWGDTQALAEQLLDPSADWDVLSIRTLINASDRAYSLGAAGQGAKTMEAVISRVDGIRKRRGEGKKKGPRPKAEIEADKQALNLELIE